MRDWDATWHVPDLGFRRLLQAELLEGLACFTVVEIDQSLR
jgi:hypothetical protein